MTRGRIKVDMPNSRHSNYLDAYMLSGMRLGVALRMDISKTRVYKILEYMLKIY